MTSKIRAEIAAKLSGLEVRQLQRSSYRQANNSKTRVRKARREGKLNTLESARMWLFENCYDHREATAFGVTCISVSCGVNIYYDPSGKISYPFRVRQIPGTDPQLPLFNA